ncbi:MAG TPA: PAS domain-containing protein [Puia sp.]|nr:PAS domain-containing protein [Puia sp.]
MNVNLISSDNGIKRSETNIGYPEKFSIEIISNGFFKVDNEWTVKYWNRAAERIVGITAMDILGKNLWKEFPSALPLEFYSIYHNKVLGDDPAHREEYLGKMGSWSDVIIYHYGDTVSVSFKSNSSPSDGQHSDRPEQRLKILNELYRFVADVTNDCLWEWNIQQHEFFWIDGGHKRVFGYQIRDSFVPQSFWEALLHPDDKDRVLAKLSELLSMGHKEIWEIEYRFKREDGDYAYVFDRGRILYDEDNKVLRMIGATQDITARKLADTQLIRERQERQKEITEAVLLAHENERKEIGKELHDNLNQILGAANLYIDVAKTDDETRAMCLHKASEYIMTVIEEIRKVSKKLVAPDMHFLSLAESIRNLVDDTMSLGSIKLSFYQTGIVESGMNEKLQVDIFRIIQEQLNNILKHSGATSAVIKLSIDANGVLLLITDNGKGCDTSKAMGLGLINIKNRAELNMGSVAVVSQPGKGYSLKVMLSLTGRK